VKRKGETFLDTLSDFEVLWTSKERNGGSRDETIHVSRVHDSLKCHRNVSKQTIPIKVDN
jgi:hypothetical protein